jgi:hypothetical protein
LRAWQRPVPRGGGGGRRAQTQLGGGAPAGADLPGGAAGGRWRRRLVGAGGRWRRRSVGAGGRWGRDGRWGPAVGGAGTPAPRAEPPVTPAATRPTGGRWGRDASTPSRAAGNAGSHTPDRSEKATPAPGARQHPPAPHPKPASPILVSNAWYGCIRDHNREKRPRNRAGRQRPQLPFGRQGSGGTPAPRAEPPVTSAATRPTGAKRLRRRPAPDSTHRPPARSGPARFWSRMHRMDVFETTIARLVPPRGTDPQPPQYRRGQAQTNGPGSRIGKPQSGRRHEHRPDASVVIGASPAPGRTAGPPAAKSVARLRRGQARPRHSIGDRDRRRQAPTIACAKRTTWAPPSTCATVCLSSLA